MLLCSKISITSKLTCWTNGPRPHMYVLLIIYENWVPTEKRNTWVLWKIIMGAWTLCMSWKMTAWASSWVETNINQFEISLKSQASVLLLLMELLVLLHIQTSNFTVCVMVLLSSVYLRSILCFLLVLESCICTWLTCHTSRLEMCYSNSWKPDTTFFLVSAAHS